MPQYIRIKSCEYGRYLIAGDVYDGHVYLQNHMDRLNSIWMMIDIPGPGGLVEFRDMKHGYRLVNGAGQKPPKDYGRDPDVAHLLPAVDNPLAQWKLIDVSDKDQIFRLSEQQSHKFLSATNENEGIHLGTNGTNNEKWQFENIPEPKGFRPRLPANDNLIWDVDLSNQPDGIRGINETQARGCIDDAVYKWLSAFREAGKEIKGARMNQSPNIIFKWGIMPAGGVDKAAYVELGDPNVLSLERTSPVTVTFDQGKSWSENGNPVFDFDLRSVAAHELGHVFGIDHSQDIAGSVMLPEIGFGQVWARQGQSLCLYDKLRLQVRYADKLYA